MNIRIKQWTRALICGCLVLAVSVPGAGAGKADEQNVLTAKRVFLEKMGAGRFDKLGEIYGKGFIAHGAAGDYTLEQDNESGREWRKAFPDLKVSVTRTVADSSFVAVHWNAKGTNSVAAAGLPGLGGRMNIDGMTFFRFNKSRIVEEWSVIDIATMMQQLSTKPK